MIEYKITDEILPPPSPELCEFYRKVEAAMINAAVERMDREILSIVMNSQDRISDVS